MNNQKKTNKKFNEEDEVKYESFNETDVKGRPTGRGYTVKTIIEDGQRRMFVKWGK
jgi:hypothetical protein